MEAKDKAKEIFEKMYATTDMMGNYPMCFDTAKQCALIACRDVKNALLDGGENWNEKVLNYYDDVENEINQL